LLVYDNIIFSLQKTGGISTYWGELCKRLILDSDLDYRFINYNKSIDNITFQLLNFPKNKIELSTYNSFISRFIKSTFGDNKSTLVHSSYYRNFNKKSNYIITVHDMIHELFFNNLKSNILINHKKQNIYNSKAIICISESTKNDLLRFYPDVDSKKIHIIYNGTSDCFYNFDESYDKYFLFVGSRSNYKNFHKLPELISTIENYSLVIIGSELKQSEVNLLNKYLPNRWKHYKNVSNIELNNFYNKAFALIYPSSYEGFGLPVLESMKAGCPVIALNTSSIPEISGIAAVLMDQLDLITFHNSVNYILNNRNEIIQNGYLNSKKFTWESCYNETKLLYKSILE
jgi:glycosyltransferase involved in cell wall biosynthesis